MRPGDWTELIAGDDRHYIQSLTTFKNLLVVEERVDGLSQIRLHDYASGAERYIAFPEASFVAALSHNPEYHVDRLRIGYESMVTPNTVFDHHLAPPHRIVAVLVFLIRILILILAAAAAAT